MGFITSEILFYICIGLAVILVAALVWIIRLEVRLRRLMRGKNGQSLEGAFLSINKDIADAKQFRKELEAYLSKVEKRLQRNIAGIHNLNFNAFSGSESGGKSFATAFINEKGDGVIISSLHARDRMSIFTKQIIGGKADVELSEEETAALTKAQESCSL